MSALTSLEQPWPKVMLGEKQEVRNACQVVAAVTSVPVAGEAGLVVVWFESVTRRSLRHVSSCSYVKKYTGAGMPSELRGKLVVTVVV